MDSATLAGVIIGSILLLIALAALAIILRRICCNVGNKPTMAPTKVRKAGGFDNPLYANNPLDNAVSMNQLILNTADAPTGVSYMGESPPNWTPSAPGFFVGQIGLEMQPDGPLVAKRTSSFTNPLFDDEGQSQKERRNLASQSSVDLGDPPVLDMTSSLVEGYVIEGVTTSESTDNDAIPNSDIAMNKRKVRFSSETCIIPDSVSKESVQEQPSCSATTGNIGVEYAQVNWPKSFGVKEKISRAEAEPPGDNVDSEGYLIPSNSMGKADDSIVVLASAEITGKITIRGVTESESNDEPIYHDIEEQPPLHKTHSDITQSSKCEGQSVSSPMDSMLALDMFGEEGMTGSLYDNADMVVLRSPLESNSFMQISPISDTEMSSDSFEQISSGGSYQDMQMSPRSGHNVTMSAEYRSGQSMQNEIMILDSSSHSFTSPTSSLSPMSPTSAMSITSWELVDDNTNNTKTTANIDLTKSFDMVEPGSPGQVDKQVASDKTFQDVMSKAWDFTDWADLKEKNKSKKTKSKITQRKDGFDNPLYTDDVRVNMAAHLTTKEVDSGVNVSHTSVSGTNVGDKDNMESFKEHAPVMSLPTQISDDSEC